MGKANPTIPITGSIQNLSYYKVRGSDQLLVRRKGGPSSEQIKNAPQFEVTRQNNKEFGGRSAATQAIANPLKKLRLVTDYNIAGILNSLFIPIQQLDTVNPVGQRSIELSKNPTILKGFNLNRKTPLDSLITSPIEYTLSKESFEATVTIPSLVPDINFSMQERYPWFKIIAVMGVMSDLYYNERQKRYMPLEGCGDYANKLTETDWLSVYPNTPSFSMTIAMQMRREDYIGKGYSCLLALGVAFGTMKQGIIQQVKYVGAGKIIAVV